MNSKALDLRILIIKYDLEKALLETYQEERILLTDSERKTLESYFDDDYDILSSIRDFLIDSDFKEETKELFENVVSNILKNYPLNSTYSDHINELGNTFITSIEENKGNNKCLFLPKTRILK